MGLGCEHGSELLGCSGPAVVGVFGVEQVMSDGSRLGWARLGLGMTMNDLIDHIHRIPHRLVICAEGVSGRGKWLLLGCHGVVVVSGFPPSGRESLRSVALQRVSAVAG